MAELNIWPLGFVSSPFRALMVIATALSMTSVLLGRIGDDIVEVAGFDRHCIGAGAVHIGTRPWIALGGASL